MDEYGFETRLRHLEYVLLGQQQQQQQIKSPDDAIVQRLGKLNRKLQSIYQKHKPIEYFMEKCKMLYKIHIVNNTCIIDDTHSKLLNPNTSTYSMERELLSTDVKLELLLAAQDDLKKFAEEVRQVKSLEHVVNGAGFDGKQYINSKAYKLIVVYIVVDELKPKLSELDIVHVDQTKQLNRLTREISELMERYNKTVSK